jgi:hypothetical protein
VIFEEDTPYELINRRTTRCTGKGGDYTIEQIVGSKEVIANGGRVVINPIVKGFLQRGSFSRSNHHFLRSFFAHKGTKRFVAEIVNCDSPDAETVSKLGNKPCLRTFCALISKLNIE